MWDPPGQGMEPMSPALVGGFFAPEPTGKLSSLFFFYTFIYLLSGLGLLLLGLSSCGEQGLLSICGAQASH